MILRPQTWMYEGRMDTDVKITVRKIFDDLRKQQPKMRSRRSDRVNVDKILEEFHKNSLTGQKSNLD